MKLMKRNEYERVSPESVGIPSQSILEMIERLEQVTEMHSIMILRHGKICAEGWWTPYAAGIPHGLQSLTKTYAATAVGIAATKGELSLDEKLADIFPEYLPEKREKYLDELTIYHLLSMTNGMDICRLGGSDWIKTFFATPIHHQPGSSFFYNTAGSGMLGAVIKKKTGRSLDEYLKTELFDKIGIDQRHIKWIRTPDGLEVAGGGMLATTEDNLRLMDLYRKHGIWDGERILSEEFIYQATSKQIETRDHSPNPPAAVDHLLGYGYQIWMCQPEGAYRADGAFGQYSIVFPKQDMVISITETTRKEDDGAQYPLDAVYPLLNDICDEILPDNPEYREKLTRKLKGLSLSNPVFQPYSSCIEEYQDSWWQVTSGKVYLSPYITDLLAGRELPTAITKFQLHFEEERVVIRILDGIGEKCIPVAMNGSRSLYEYQCPETPFQYVYCNAYWEAENMLTLKFRWIESAYERTLRFKFDDPRMIISSEDLVSFHNLDIEDAAAIRLS